MSDNLVSIIIPIFNVEEFVAISVRSVIDQTYPNIEIILIDDGSVDNSGKLADNLSQEFPHITVIHTSNLGLSSARNLGIKTAIGDFLFFLDSDDWVEPTLIQDAINYLTQKDLGFVSFTNDFVNDKGIPISKKNNDSEYYQNQVFTSRRALELLFQEKIRISAWSYIVRRDILVDNNIYFPVGKKYEDNCTTPMIIQKAERVGLLTTKSRAYYHYRMRQKSITHQFDHSNIDDMLYMIRFNLENFSRFPALNYYIFSKSLAAFFVSSKINYYRVEEIDMQIKRHFSVRFIFINSKIFLKFGYWSAKRLFLCFKRILEKFRKSGVNENEKN
ncbi:glycosyltransferase family 2 protein [Oenococcus sp.]|uniref:glycosyltransferase family 2 protein n=1 Tax=Oenococcus sp. TaxID=1979414 RepID=UPI0039EA6265